MSFIRLVRHVAPLNESTPSCVLVELFKTLGIRVTITRDNQFSHLLAYQKIIDKRLKIQLETLEQYKQLARLMNPIPASWNRFNLKLAYAHSILSAEEFSRLPGTLNSKSNNKPEAWDLIQCYSYLVFKNIDTTFDTSELELYAMVYMYAKLDVRSLLFGFLDRSVEKIVTVEQALRAAWLQDFDLSLSNDPLYDYYYYSRVSGVSEKSTASLQRIEKINPKRLVVAAYPNARIPFDCYSETAKVRLLSLVKLDGLYTDEVEEAFEHVQQTVNQTAFYHRLQPEVLDTHTHIYKHELATVDPLNIICYGVINQTMRAYTIDELSQMFRVNQRFTDWSFQYEFTKQEISRLRTIAVALSKHSALAQELADVIESIKHIDHLAKPAIQRFIKSQDNYADIMQLWQVAMYMRGYKVTSDEWPITSAAHTQNLEQETAINDNVATSAAKLSKIIKNLPLARWRLGAFEILDTTVEQRLLWIAEGSESTNDEACIRINSNWFVYSCLYYLQIINKPMNIDLDSVYYAT